MNLMSKAERKEIFTLFLKKDRLKFNEIEKNIKVRSNKLAYYLDSLKKKNILKKEGDYWCLTKDAEKLIPFFKQLTLEEVGTLGVVLLAIVNKGKILLTKREHKPYKGYWSLIGGRFLLHESIEEASIRKALEETKLNVKFDRVLGVIHERLKEDKEVKHAFIFFLVKLTAKEDALHFKNLKWFDLKKIPKKGIIPSDYWMIKNLLNKKSKVTEIIMEEKKGKLKLIKTI